MFKENDTIWLSEPSFKRELVSCIACKGHGKGESVTCPVCRGSGTSYISVFTGYIPSGPHVIKTIIPENDLRQTFYQLKGNREETVMDVFTTVEEAQVKCDSKNSKLIKLKEGK